MSNHQIHCQYFSQEDLLGAGCLDMEMAMKAAEDAMIADLALSFEADGVETVAAEDAFTGKDKPLLARTGRQ